MARIKICRTCRYESSFLCTQWQLCNKESRESSYLQYCNASKSCIDDSPIICVYRFRRNTRLLVTRSVKERSLWETSRYLGLWYVTSIMLTKLVDYMICDWMICKYHFTVMNLVLQGCRRGVVKHIFTTVKLYNIYQYACKLFRYKHVITILIHSAKMHFQNVSVTLLWCFAKDMMELLISKHKHNDFNAKNFRHHSWCKQ